MTEVPGLEQLMGDAAPLLVEELWDSIARTRPRAENHRAGNREEIKIVVQGGHVVEVEGPPRRRKVAAPVVTRLRASLRDRG